MCDFSGTKGNTWCWTEQNELKFGPGNITEIRQQQLGYIADSCHVTQGKHTCVEQADAYIYVSATFNLCNHTGTQAWIVGDLHLYLKASLCIFYIIVY